MMSISSLAWDADEDEVGFALLQSLGVRVTEAIPARIKARGFHQFQDILACNDLTACAFQSIFFGVSDLHLLRSEDTFTNLLNYVHELAEVADAMGVPVGIFGAPALRSAPELTSDARDALGFERLKRLDDALQSHDFCLALEPVPACYGNGYLTRCSEIYEALQELDAKRLTLVLDTACVGLGEENLPMAFQSYGAEAVHVHVAEPNLKGFAEVQLDHVGASAALVQSGYSGPISIEMRRQSDDWQDDISIAVRYLQKTYADLFA